MTSSSHPLRSDKKGGGSPRDHPTSRANRVSYPVCMYPHGTTWNGSGPVVNYWSGMTVACGLATAYWQLFAARGVGIGEAALVPAAYSTNASRRAALGVPVD